MHHFAYRDGVLHAEDVDLDIIADEIGTPFYCYSTATLERHYRVMAEAFKGTLIIVSNEVGLGVVPDNQLGRRFRDIAGWANQLIAAAADEVTFMAAGLPLALKKTRRKPASKAKAKSSRARKA